MLCSNALHRCICIVSETGVNVWKIRLTGIWCLSFVCSHRVCTLIAVGVFVDVCMAVEVWYDRLWAVG